MERSQIDTESPTRKRTRNAILRSAVKVLVPNPSASLGEISEAAGVARSTLHRYFPERSDLIEQLRAYAEEELKTATANARLGHGTGAEALTRLFHEYFDRWEVMMWAYMDALRPEQGTPRVDEELDPDLSTLIARGREDGTIDRTLPDAWIQQIVWSILYSAWDYINRGGGTRHEALELSLNVLRRVVAPAEPGADAHS